jgi:hypothetical protein
MPAHYGPVWVSDPPEELPEYVGTRNESYATLKSLVWDRDALPDDGVADGASGRHFDLLPAVIPRDTRPSALRMRKRRPTVDPTQRGTGANVFGGDAGDPMPASPRDREHRGLRTLATTRALVGDSHFLEQSGKEITVGRGVPKPETNLWDFQKRPCFDLRHEVAGVERSKLQIRQDAEREENRKRRRAFTAHLRQEARYRPVNRINLRHDSPDRQLRQVVGDGTAARPPPPFAINVPRPPPGGGPVPPSADLRRAASARHRPAVAAPSTPNAASIGQTPSDTPRRDARPILSARVRHRIAALADEFLTPRAPPN